MPFEGMGAAVASLAGKFGKKKKEEEGDYESNKKKYGAGRAREMESKHKTLAGSIGKYQKGGEEAHTAVEKYQGGHEEVKKQKTVGEIVRGRKPEKKKAFPNKEMEQAIGRRRGRLQRPTPPNTKRELTHDGTGKHRPINMA